ncbi:ABC transporter substrate-binding protein [Haloglomus halophilum]|uniref:ABC transporter substrate-binding protein n=1 Tax=Haloglomus halophilum TaxID=2962672 RepID=UPI0020C9ABD3|nr:ABC transporter substrate-binding protein [Haloglomus halophilum]
MTEQTRETDSGAPSADPAGTAVDSGQDRRSFLRYAGAGSTAALAAGCKSRKAQNRGEGGFEGSIGGGSGTGTAPPQPLAGNTIRLGCLAPQPESFPVGQSMWKSMQLAVEDINKNGVPGIGGRGILGAKLKAFSGNTEASPGTARKEFRRLVQKERCKTTFGTFLTQCTLQIFNPMKATRTVHITTAAAGPKPGRIVHDRYDEFKWHFRAGPIHSYDLARAELEFLNLYADKLGWNTAAALIENIAPFDPFAELLKPNMGEFFDDVPVFKRSSSGTTNWTPLFDEVGSSGADICLIAHALTGTAAVKQWANQNRPFEMGGISLPAQIYEFWEEVSGACRYIFTMNAVTPQTTNTPRTQDFMKRYRKKFDTYPVYSGPITYDAVRAYATAMARYVLDNNLEKIPTNADMVKALEKYKFDQGTILPEIKFTPPEADYAHEPAWTSMKETGVPVWQQWQVDEEIAKDYGVMHSFAPEQNKTADYSYPDWINYPKNHPANQKG